MHYEVEQKFPVDNAAGLRRRLAELGAVEEPAVVQVDRYYAHPARDFATTDEALRLRRDGGEWRITYKGPKLDPATKTRREIELPLATADPEAADWAALLEALGFLPVAEVRKVRRPLGIVWEGRQVRGAWDEVESLGTFLELELSANDADLDSARACILSLAAALNLQQPQRRSYLELLLSRG